MSLAYWLGFGVGVVFAFFVRWIIDTSFGPRGATDRRYPTESHTWTWSDASGWRTRSADPDVIPLDERRRGGAA